jgi:hypothetical protein
MAGKLKAKDKLYNNALSAVDELYDSDQVSTADTVEQLNNLKTQIDLRLNILKDVTKENEG